MLQGKSDQILCETEEFIGHSVGRVYLSGLDECGKMGLRRRSNCPSNKPLRLMRRRGYNLLLLENGLKVGSSQWVLFEILPGTFCRCPSCWGCAGSVRPRLWWVMAMAPAETRAARRAARCSMVLRSHASTFLRLPGSMSAPEGLRR